MPIQRVKGGWKWGQAGKVFKTKKGAVNQARAIYAAKRNPHYKKNNGIKTS
jgi:hypothetical protein